MIRPQIICHMTMSLDGMVTGDFLAAPESADAIQTYYQIHRSFGADAFACGRITMEGSFTGGWYPDLNDFGPRPEPIDWLPDDVSGFYAVAFDPHGRLGWKSARIEDPDGDPGYDKARIIEVLTRQADRRYLSYLQFLEIPYIFAGDTQIDVEEALMKLRSYFGIQTLLLEGGSILNGAFQRCGVIDELSLVVAPVTAEGGKPLFTQGAMDAYRLTGVRREGDTLVLNYKR